MYDAHCHLAADELTEDLPDVIKRAQNVGVQGVLCVAEFASDFEPILSLQDRYPGFVHAALGIHPVQKGETGGTRAACLVDYTDDVEQFIEKNSAAIVAIGEVGLDFTPRYHQKDAVTGKYLTHDQQRAVFQKQIELAKRLNLPLNCHSRSAGKPTIEMLRLSGASQVSLHAFDGNWKAAMVGAELGYYFSVPPCIARSPQKQDLVKHLPLSNLLLETDSPALGPVKEERNELCNIKISAEWIADIKKISVEDVCAITSENARKIFPCFNKIS